MVEKLGPSPVNRSRLWKAFIIKLLGKSLGKQSIQTPILEFGYTHPLI
jgi:hypothetical protein